jgi:hypothetical protein
MVPRREEICKKDEGLCGGGDNRWRWRISMWLRWIGFGYFLKGRDKTLSRRSDSGLVGGKEEPKTRNACATRETQERCD